MVVGEVRQRNDVAVGHGTDRQRPGKRARAVTLGSSIRRATVAMLLLTAMSVPTDAAVGNWTDATGFWDVVTNWSSNPLLPGATDDVVINVAGVQTITHRSGTDTVQSLAITDDNLAVTGGSLTVTGTGTTNARGGIALGGTIQNDLTGAASSTTRARPRGRTPPTSRAASAPAPAR
jgi:hypothetical protein